MPFDLPTCSHNILASEYLHTERGLLGLGFSFIKNFHYEALGWGFFAGNFFRTGYSVK
jgi:hypothetical protein